MNIEDLKGCFANVNDDTLLRDVGNLYAENKELKQEIERLHNIIKEVREKINKAIIDTEIIGNGTLNLSELLKILDKENNNGI